MLDGEAVTAQRDAFAVSGVGEYMKMAAPTANSSIQAKSITMPGALPPEHAGDADGEEQRLSEA